MYLCLTQLVHDTECTAPLWPQSCVKADRQDWSIKRDLGETLVRNGVCQTCVGAGSERLLYLRSTLGTGLNQTKMRRCCVAALFLFFLRREEGHESHRSGGGEARCGEHPHRSPPHPPPPPPPHASPIQTRPLNKVGVVYLLITGKLRWTYNFFFFLQLGCKSPMCGI